MSAIGLRAFCHVTLNVSDMQESLAFYRDLVGLQVIFDVALDGEGLDSITGIEGSKGRMVGTVAPGGTMVEMVHGVYPETADGSPRGARDSFIFSLSVEDVDRAHQAFLDAGIEPLQRPAEIDGTRMFFVLDPDGRRVEFVEYPDGAPRAAEMHGWSG